MRQQGTDLAANPNLWGKVADAMDRSRYLIVVLSPRAAASEWVNREVAHWLERQGPEQLLIVVAEGHLHWDEATERFDPDRSDAALPVLTEPGVFPGEPLYVDVTGDARWDPQAPTFRDKVTDLAVPSTENPSTNWPAMTCASSADSAAYGASPSPPWPSSLWSPWPQLLSRSFKNEKRYASATKPSPSG
jgi:MTH538 TIR-like domain (DUF1863)